MKRPMLQALFVAALAMGVGHAQAHSDKHKADDKSERKSMDHDKAKKSGDAKKGGGHEGKH